MIKQQIISRINEVLKEMSIDGINTSVDFPSDISHGDYFTNVAFIVAQKKHTNAFEVAKEIVQKLKVSQDFNINFEKIETVKPGFINFTLSQKYLITQLSQMTDKSDNLAKSGKLEKKKIMVEYAHPNTHKEMHIGHMRTLITGESIARLLQSQGAIVFRANYQGDIGPHVAKALYGTEKIMRERNLSIQDISTWTNEEKAHLLGEGYVLGNKDYDISKNQIDQINSILYQQKPGHYLDFYHITHKWSMDYYDQFYKRFMTKFDKLFLESQVYQDGLKIVRSNINKVFTQSDGAVVFKGEKYGLHTRVFITAQGYPTYEGKEMSLGFKEYEAFPFDEIIHVVGSEQAGYFQVVFKALEVLDPQKFKDKQIHIPMGMVQLSDRKISSRTGVILRVDWLINQVKQAVEKLFKEAKFTQEEKETTLDQIAIGAIKYSVLKVGTKQDVAFNIEKSVSIEGDSAVYIQYTYARTQSILLKIDQSKPNSDFSDYQSNEDELFILRLLSRFNEVVTKSAEELSPNHLCAYLYELAKLYNVFYQKHRIFNAPDEKQRIFRLSLTKATGSILSQGLNLLGIAAPRRM